MKMPLALCVRVCVFVPVSSMTLWFFVCACVCSCFYGVIYQCVWIRVGRRQRGGIQPFPPEETQFDGGREELRAHIQLLLPSWMSVDLPFSFISARMDARIFFLILFLLMSYLSSPPLIHSVTLIISLTTFFPIIGPWSFPSPSLLHPLIPPLFFVFFQCCLFSVLRAAGLSRVDFPHLSFVLALALQRSSTTTPHFQARFITKRPDLQAPTIGTEYFIAYEH